MTDPEVWYRVEGICYAAPLDEWDDPIGTGRRALRVEQYRVLKHTPCGVWVSHQYDFGSTDKRFIRTTARKRFACPTLAEAHASFQARKERQITILSHQLADARTFLKLSQKETRPV